MSVDIIQSAIRAFPLLQRLQKPRLYFFGKLVSMSARRSFGVFISLSFVLAPLVHAQEPSDDALLDDNQVVTRVDQLGGKIARDKALAGNPIVEIDLSGTPVTDDDLRLVRNLTQLQTLNLHRTQVSDVGMRHLESLSSLTTLTVGDTRITNEGLRALTHLHQLQFLGLHGTRVSDEGMPHLKAFPRLTSLFLSKSDVTDKSMKTLEGLSNLELLWLSETRVADAGLVKLESLKKLKSLSLEKTAITDDGLLHLEGLRDLIYLDLRGTKVTTAGLTRLTSRNKIKHVAHDFPRFVPGVTIAIGEMVTDWTVVDLNGKNWSINELHRIAGFKERRPVVMTFWCSFCPSCRQVEHRLDALAKKYADKAVVVALDASAGETSAMCRKVADEKGLSLPILLDASGHLADLFGTEVTTTTVVIDADGVLRYRGQFAEDKESYAEAALASILNARPVSVPTTPHVGCPIVRK